MERKSPDIVDTTMVNYQFCMNSELTSMCFLLNVHTGEMWRFEYDEKTFEKIEMPWEAKKED